MGANENVGLPGPNASVFNTTAILPMFAPSMDFMGSVAMSEAMYNRTLLSRIGMRDEISHKNLWNFRAVFIRNLIIISEVGESPTGQISGKHPRPHFC